MEETDAHRQWLSGPAVHFTALRRESSIAVDGSASVLHAQVAVPAKQRNLPWDDILDAIRHESLSLDPGRPAVHTAGMDAESQRCLPGSSQAVWSWEHRP